MTNYSAPLNVVAHAYTPEDAQQYLDILRKYENRRTFSRCLICTGVFITIDILISRRRERKKLEKEAERKLDEERNNATEEFEE